MAQNDFINQFIQQFNTLFGPGFESLSAELRQQVRTAAMAAFSKMELVTREEFDTQRVVLMRSRQKLEALETQVAQLEQQISAATAKDNRQEPESPPASE